MLVPSGSPLLLLLWVGVELPGSCWRPGLAGSSLTPSRVGAWQALWSSILMAEPRRLGRTKAAGSGEEQGLTLMVQPVILVFLVLRVKVPITLLYFLPVFDSWMSSRSGSSFSVT